MCVCRGIEVAGQCDGRLGLVAWGGIGVLFIADCEEMVCSWCGTFSGDFLGEVVNDFCHVLDHRYLCYARLGEIKVHSKVVMDWSAVEDEAIAIHCGKIGCILSDLEGVCMWSFQVIHMPSDHHLFIADSCMCNEGVVWVDNKWG